jgi:hypothetical protein
VGINKGRGKCSSEEESNHYFLLPDTFSTPTKGTKKPAFLTTNLAAPSTNMWSTSLGWEEYVDEITEALGLCQKAVDKLYDLVSLPSIHHISMAIRLLKILEHGLLISVKLNLAYLKDAAT